MTTCLDIEMNFVLAKCTKNEGVKAVATYLDIEKNFVLAQPYKTCLKGARGG